MYNSAAAAAAAAARRVVVFVLTKMQQLIQRAFIDTAATLQGRAEASFGVSLPFLVCIAAVLLAYAILAAAALRIVSKVLKNTPGSSLSLSSKPRVALLGPSNSGKTCCFLALRNGRATETVPSLAANRCEVPLVSLHSAAAATAAVEDGRDSSSGVSAALERRTVGIVDSPGHQRLRPEALASAAASSVLIFFVDAADKPSLKGAAEFLFELFCHPKVHECRPPLLLVVNKKDKPEARGQQAVIEDLEREIERCRVSRQLTFEGEDSVAAFIGQEGKRFVLQDDAPCLVDVCSAAVGVGDLSAIPSFILQHTT